tara:strand:- start:703 stop:1098 length:396 start_codon:yes stop_codon:yes gene_type:complete
MSSPEEINIQGVSLMDKFKEKIKDIEIKAETLMTILRYAMELVELTQLKGKDQKDMALQLLTRVIEESNLDESKKSAYLDMVISGIIGNAVDLIVDASKGNLHINENVKKAKSAFNAAKKVLRAVFSCLKV